jgi:predicted metal-dependent HD superfamily phosphohydrolase
MGKQGTVTIGDVMRAMISYYAGDPRRINHFLKVYGFAKVIGEMESLDERTQNILEVAALTHDIGIKVSEAKYGNCAGQHQEIEGPPVARTMLEGLGCNPSVIDRVCWLIAHHHTYNDIDEIDYQILVEADFLVNIVEDDLTGPAVDSIREKIFRTQTGIEILEHYRPKSMRADSIN